MKRIVLPVTVDASGDGSYTGLSATGLLYAAQLVDGSFDDGVDITLTSEVEGLSIPVLVKANFNSDQMTYPRVLEALNTDGTSLSTHCMPVVFGALKAVVAGGGNAKSGSFVLYIIED